MGEIADDLYNNWLLSQLDEDEDEEMARPKYNAVVPIDTPNGQTYWHRVGAGFVGNNNSISILFNSLPLPNKDGVVKVMLFENKDDDEGVRKTLAPRQGTRPSYREELDDEIPF